MTFESLNVWVSVVPGLLIVFGVATIALRLRFRWAAMRAFSRISEGGARVKRRRRVGWG